MTAETKPTTLIFAKDATLVQNLRNWFGEFFPASKKLCLVCVSDNAFDPRSPYLEGVSRPEVNRMLIVFIGRPISLKAMAEAREWAVNHKNVWDLTVDFVSNDAGESEFKAVVAKNCQKWFAEKPKAEDPAIKIGEWVTMPEGRTAKDDSSLLTMMFGSMGKLLTNIEVIARRFSAAVAGIDDKKKTDYRQQIDSLLKAGAKPSGTKPASVKARKGDEDNLLGIGNVTDQLPKLLLLGESGVGKTLIAGYLHERCGLEGRPLHISIPEYLGKEDMFEYSLFGYAAGNYTGGKPDGDHGLLLQNVGGVIFLDEIGEANAAIQAKLLTFLDHFRVRPRGWLGDPFYCPVLIVAATNRDLEEQNSVGTPRFRRDLLARFTDSSQIPPLRDRKGDFEFILDCLLQRESMNPGRQVREIGKDALSHLRTQGFKEGNFRELEDLFRTACKKALRDDRHYLVESDFKKAN
jgi:hypothetical protein